MATMLFFFHFWWEALSLANLSDVTLQTLGNATKYLDLKQPNPHQWVRIKEQSPRRKFWLSPTKAEV